MNIFECFGSYPAAKTTEASEAFELLNGGKYFLLPSFFKCLANLVIQKRKFSVVLRTFGTDVGLLGLLGL